MSSCGWYYLMDGLTFETIAYLDDSFDELDYWHGPYKTYSAAKQNVRERYKCDLQDILQGKQNLKTHRKPKKIK